MKDTFANIINNNIMPALDGCWYWTGPIGGHGYGVFRYNKKQILSHRASFIAFKGDIKKGLFVCHNCDNRMCVNPDHLFIGAPIDNVRDMIKKGRNVKPKGENHYYAKLTNDAVLLIREMSEYGFSRYSLGVLFGVSHNTIKLIALKRTWKHI